MNRNFKFSKFVFIALAQKLVLRLGVSIIRFFICISSLFLFVNAWAERKLEFNRDIRPILSDSCFHCHGPDEKERKGGLRLDLEKDAFKEAKSGFQAIVKGGADESELIARIFLPKDDEEHMPPIDSGKSITLEQKNTLRKWIEQGADYQGHWAFISPQRKEVPKIANKEHPIDAFISERLQREGLAMKKIADKETLLRRASLDLIGLPPSLEEIDMFMKDDSSNAYERMLDRMLASPHYGERMAIEWLDLARYADSNGYQSDGSRDMWLWRDWLINAYNRNLPFDQFTIEQLAGDMLPNATEDQIIATGFNRNHRLNGEGGRIVEEWFVETVIDRVDTTGTTWLGLTMSCARCHDHKYDPISQKEFFEFFAFFNSNDESGVLAANGKNGFNTMPFIKVANSSQKIERAKLEARLKQVQDGMGDAEKQMPDALDQWMEQTRQYLKDGEKPKELWTRLTNEKVVSSGGATFKMLGDGSWLVAGKNPVNDTYEIRSQLNVKELAGILIEVFPDQSFPENGPGRTRNGNFVMTGLEVSVVYKDKKTQPEILKLENAKASFEQKGYPVKLILANAQNLTKKGTKGWALDGFDASKGQPAKAMFMAKKPIVIRSGAELVVKIYHQSVFKDHNIGRFRLSRSSRKVSSLDEEFALPEEILAYIKKPIDSMKLGERKKLDQYFRVNERHPLTVAKSKVEQAKKTLDQFNDSLPSTMVMKEKAVPKDAFILNRGEYDQPLEKVGRALPRALPPLPEGEPVNRLGLARWLVSGDHPLTGRVWVNRIWERLFGFGIVKTSENFGSQAEWPVHPELLDWLAVEFTKPSRLPKVGGQVAKAWDMKGMIKFIMMSQTYQQSSHAPEELYRQDPENRLLARGSRFRLAGELVRDQALAVSGLLISKLGGPSTRPYMPPGVWSETNRYGNLKNYIADSGEGLYRRSMYTIWKRTAAPPSMLLFDAPNREICFPKRSRTNTPLQALALLNEVTYVEASRALAERMMKEGGDTIESRLSMGFRLVTSRTPDAYTVKVLKKGFEGRRKKFEKDIVGAKSLITQGSSKPDPSLALPELAAYSTTASILLNLDRVITKD